MRKKVLCLWLAQIIEAMSIDDISNQPTLLKDTKDLDDTDFELLRRLSGIYHIEIPNQFKSISIKEENANEKAKKIKDKIPLLVCLFFYCTHVTLLSIVSSNTMNELNIWRNSLLLPAKALFGTLITIPYVTCFLLVGLIPGLLYFLPFYFAHNLWHYSRKTHGLWILGIAICLMILVQLCMQENVFVSYSKYILETTYCTNVDVYKTFTYTEIGDDMERFNDGLGWLLIYHIFGWLAWVIAYIEYYTRDYESSDYA